MKLIFSLVMLLFVSGCCTIKSQLDIQEHKTWYQKPLCDNKGHFTRPVMYSGTAMDLEILLWPAVTDCHGEGCMLILIWPLFIIPTLIDLPLDIAADTVLLPYTTTVSLTYTCPSKEPQAEDVPEITTQAPVRKRAKKAIIKRSKPPANKIPIVTPDVGKPQANAPPAENEETSADEEYE